MKWYQCLELIAVFAAGYFVVTWVKRLWEKKHDKNNIAW